MSTPNQTIEDKLRQAWRQQRRFYHVRGVSRFLLWLVVMLVVDFLIDWGIFFRNRMTMKVGLLLLTVNVIILGCVLWFEWLRHLKSFNALLVSLDIEEKHPELESMLVSYTQLDGPIKDQPNVSPELIAAMREQAMLRTQPLDFRSIVNFGQLKKLLLVAGCVLLLFGAVSLLNPDHLRALVERLTGKDSEYPTNTQVYLESEERVFKVGAPVVVVARAEGKIPETGELHVRPADGSADWKTIPLNKIGDSGKFSQTLDNIQQDLEYYVEIGDDETEPVRILAIAAPQATPEVKLIYPTYLDKAPGRESRFNVEVPQGTRLEWTLSCDKAVKHVDLITTHVIEGKKVQKTHKTEVSEDGLTVRFALDAAQDFKYTFRWIERDSGKDFEYDDVLYTVRTISDSIPSVTLLKPVDSGLATVDLTVNLEAIADDDHGLAKAWLVYSLGNDSKESRLEIFDFKGAPGKRFEYPWELKKDIKGLKPGAQVTLAIEVSDRKGGKERYRRSDPRQFTIVEKDEYERWAQREVARVLEKIRQVKESEQKSSKAIKQIKSQGGNQ